MLHIHVLLVGDLKVKDGYRKNEIIKLFKIIDHITNFISYDRIDLSYKVC